jgi:hypothetical protein
VIQLLKILSALGQAITPLLSFEMMGCAAFVVVMTQNALIGIDSRRESGIQETHEQ